MLYALESSSAGTRSSFCMKPGSGPIGTRFSIFGCILVLKGYEKFLNLMKIIEVKSKAECKALSFVVPIIHVFF